MNHISSEGDEAQDCCSADPTDSWRWSRFQVSEAGYGVGTASGELVFRTFRDFVGCVRKCALGGVGQEIADVRTQQADILAHSVEKARGVTVVQLG